MILEPILTEALSAGRQDREQSTVHPIVMLPSHRAVEIETRVRGIALSLNRKTDADSRFGRTHSSPHAT